jgi:diguanylate cyclase (GGDEF)-like protein
MSGTLDTRTPDHDAARIVDELNAGAVGILATDLARALATAEDALARSEEAGYDRGAAQARKTIGECRHRLADHAAARQPLEQALASFHELGDAHGAAAAASTLGSVEYALADYPAALRRFHEALLLARTAEDRALEGGALGGTATSYYALGDHERAAAFYRDCVEARRDIGDRAGESAALSNLGLVHQELGDFASAAELHRQALQVKRELADREGEVSVLANLGVDLHRLGEHEEARTLHREALELARVLGNGAAEAGCLENLALIAEALGELPEALALHETALGLHRSCGDRFREARSRARAGAMRFRLGDRTGALDDLQASVRLGEELGALRIVVDARRSLAEVYAGLGDLRAALECSNVTAGAEQELFREQLERSADALTARFAAETALREADVERRVQAELERAAGALREARAERDDLLARLRGQAEELERVVRDDLLTGLASRQHFEDELRDRFERACAAGEPLSVAILDVDHFKLVNEIPRSHRVGDAVLRELAAMLRVGVRDTDLVARWSGEEIALVIDDTREAAASACERVRAAVEVHDWSRLHPSIRVTVSVGIAGAEEAASSDDLLFVADKRLFEAMDSGRNRVCW